MTARTTTAVPGSVQERRSSGIWRDALGRLMKNRLAVLGLLFVIFLAVLGTLGPNFAPYRYDFQDTRALIENLFIPIPPLQHPTHYLGTDELGHDILSRIMDGAQISLSVALVVQLVVLLIGLPLGAIAGWFGGRIDTYLMRFTDVMYAFPDLLLIILMSVAFRDTAFGRLYSGLFLVFIAIGLTSWVTVARLVRGQLLSLKEMEFVEAAKALGVRDRNIVMRHLLPNAIGPIIVAVTLGIPGAILAEFDACLPRRWRSGTTRVMGQSHRRRAGTNSLFAPFGVYPGHHDCPGTNQLHVPGRRPPRRPRSQAQGQAVG